MIYLYICRRRMFSANDGISNTNCANIALRAMPSWPKRMRTRRSAYAQAAP